MRLLIMKKKILPIHYTLIMLITIILFSSIALSRPYIHLEDKEPLSACLFEKTIITGYLKNDDAFPQTYNLSLRNPNQNFASLSKEEFYLGAGKATKFQISITPNLNIPLGNTIIEIIISSQTHNYSKYIPITLKNCHNIELETPPIIEICKGEKLNNNIYIKNLGLYDEEISLILESDIEEFNQESVILLPKNLIKKIPLQSEINELGEFIINYEIKLTQQDNYIVEKQTKIIAKSCPSAEITSAQYQKQCIGETNNISIEIKNTAIESDHYTIYINNEEKADLLIKPLESKTIQIPININPIKKNDFPIELKIISKNGFEKEIPLLLEYTDCSNINTQIKNNPLNICQDLTDEIPITLILQNGPTQKEYNLKSQNIFLDLPSEIETISLTPFEKKELIAKINIPRELGEYNEVLTINTRNSLYNELIKLNIIDCYDFDADIKAKKEACNNTEIEYNLTIYNFGEVADEYTIQMILPYQKHLGDYKVEKTTDLNIPFKLLIQPTKTIEKVLLKITSKSRPYLSTTAQKSFLVEDCINYEIKAPKNLEVCAFEEGKIPIVVKNTATQSNQYNLKFICPSYISYQNQTFSLNPSEEKQILLNYKIPKEFEKTSYCAILVNSDKTTTQTTYQLIISLLSQKDCFCAESELSDFVIELNKPQKPLELKIKNCGRISDSYQIKVFGELKNYIKITSPETLELDPKESQTFYIQTTSPIKEDINEINNTITLAVQSKNTDLYQEYKIKLKN